MSLELKNWLITAVCESGHTQSLRVLGETRVWVESYAALMDGTSPLYVEEPGPHSVIGKCARCGKPFRCEIVEEPC